MEKTQKDVLIIGAGGLLGRALETQISQKFSVAAPSKEELDMTQPQALASFCRKVSPRVIVLAAAYTDVDGCEENPALAHQVNVEGVRHTVAAAQECGAVLIFISTDYVFDGTKQGAYSEEDEPSAISVYGQTKQKAEEMIRSSCLKSIIVRSCWIFGKGRKNFVSFIRENLRQKKPLRVVADKTGSPTYAVDLAEAIGELLNLIFQDRYDFDNDSVVHVVNGGSCSWYTWAKFIAQQSGNQDAAIEETTLDAFPFKAKRPKNSVLETSRYKKITGKTMRSWQDALKEFLECQNS